MKTRILFAFILLFAGLFSVVRAQAVGPVSASVAPGKQVLIGVTNDGTAPFTYQWKKGSGVIAGATLNTFTIASFTAADAGVYTVVVSNVAGSVTSPTATLTLVSAPTITTQPTSAASVPGGSASFSVVAGGAGPFTYQWTKNGAAIAGATAATFTIANVQTGDAANYAVTVTGPGGAITSNTVILVVNVIPTITGFGLQVSP